MKKNIILMISFVFLFSLAFISSANTVTLTLPAQDASISGSTYILNADVDTNTENLTSATFFYDDGSSNTTIGTTVNDSLTEFNYTWDTTALVDVNDWTIWVNVSNETTMVTSDASTGVDIDNGNPTATLSSATFTDNLALITGTTFTIGIDADATIGISSCNVYYTHSSGTITTTQAVSAVANACTTSTTPTAQSLSINEYYTVKIEATDGNGNTTNSTARTLRVTPASAGGGGGTTTTTQDTSDTTTSDYTPVDSKKASGITRFFQSIIDFFRNLFS